MITSKSSKRPRKIMGLHFFSPFGLFGFDRKNVLAPRLKYIQEEKVTPKTLAFAVSPQQMLSLKRVFIISLLQYYIFFRALWGFMFYRNDCITFKDGRNGRISSFCGMWQPLESSFLSKVDKDT